MPTILKQLLLQFVLIALNAFFAATEIAVVSLNSQKMRALADDGDKKAAKIAKILDDPTRFLSTIQVGITLAGFLGSAFAADSFGDMLAAALAKDGSNYELIKTVSVIIVTLILSYYTLVLGELVPKKIAIKNAEKLSLALSGFIRFVSALFAPIVWILTKTTNGVLRLFGINPNEEEEAAIKYRVSSIPNIIAFKKGEVKANNLGFVPQEMLENFVKNNL